MGAAKKSASTKQMSNTNTKTNLAVQATIQPNFNETARTKAQRILYREMRIAERCILSPDDELYGIAVPSVS